MLGEEVAAIERKLRDDHARDLAELRAELQQLRAELAQQKAADAGPVDLPSWRSWSESDDVRH
jgi:hypothetical protein